MRFGVGYGVLINGRKVVIIASSIVENTLIGTFEETNLGQAKLVWDWDGKIYPDYKYPSNKGYDSTFDLKEMIKHGETL